jgi:hypothetical protein
MTTLTDLNSNPHVSHHQFAAWLPARGAVDYTLEQRYAVGSQSKRWSNSPKTHLLITQRVTAADWTDGPVDRRSYKVGDTFSAYTPCNSNGQHTGTVFAKLDTDAITCTKCLKYLEGRG